MTTPNTAAFAPMPSARVSTASSENSFERIAERTPKWRSCRRSAIQSRRASAPLLGQHLRALALYVADVAETVERRGARGGGIHSLCYVVANALLEVERELVVHLGLRRGLEWPAYVEVRKGVAHGQLAQLGACAEATACVTAAAKRCHPDVCSWNCRFPSAVRR